MTRNEIVSIGTVVAFLLLLLSIPFWPGVGLPTSGAGSAPKPGAKYDARDRQRAADAADAQIAELQAQLDQLWGVACAGDVSLGDQTLTSDESVPQALIRAEVEFGVLRGEFPETPGRGRFVGGRGDYVVVDWTATSCRVVDQGTLAP